MDDWREVTRKRPRVEGEKLDIFLANISDFKLMSIFSKEGSIIFSGKTLDDWREVNFFGIGTIRKRPRVEGEVLSFWRIYHTLS